MRKPKTSLWVMTGTVILEKIHINITIHLFLGDLINIPVLMIKKSDGENIKEFLLSKDETVSKSVSVSITFELVRYFSFA